MAVECATGFGIKTSRAKPKFYGVAARIPGAHGKTATILLCSANLGLHDTQIDTLELKQ